MIARLKDFIGRLHTSINRVLSRPDLEDKTLNELNQLFKFAVNQKPCTRSWTNWFKEKQKTPWVFVVYQDYRQAIAFVKNSSSIDPVSAKSQSQSSPCSVLLTQRGGIVLWPYEWVGQLAINRWLKGWLKKHRSTVATPWIIYLPLSVSEQHSDQHALQLRDISARFQPLFDGHPKQALAEPIPSTGASLEPLLNHPLVLSDSDHSTHVIAIEKTLAGWINGIFSTYAVNSHAGVHVTQSEQLNTLDRLSLWVDHVKQLCEPLIGQNPFHPPFCLQAIVPLPADNRSFSNWWDRLIWQTNPLPSHLNNQTLIKKTVWLHAGLACCTLLLWSIMCWSMVKQQLHALSTRHLVTQVIQQASFEPDARSFNHLAQIADWSHLKSSTQQSELKRWWFYPSKLLRLNILTAVDAFISKQVLNGFDTVLVKPIGQHLEQQLAHFSDASLTNRSESTLDSMYPTLKLYLMMSDASRADSNYFQSKLPAHLRRILENNQQWSDGVRSDAQKVLMAYSLSHGQPGWPTLNVNQDLVYKSRSLLSSNPTGNDHLIRLFADVIDKASADFPAVQLSSILDGTDLRWLTGSYTVPGAFTRKAYETYIRPTFIQLSKEGQHSTDWVTGTEQQAKPIDRVSDNSLAFFDAQYKKAFYESWLQFISHIAWKPTMDPNLLNLGLNALEHRDGSPYWKIFSRITDEAKWSASLVTQGIDQTKKLVRQDNKSQLSDVFSIGPLHNVINTWGPSNSVFATTYADKVANLSKSIQSTGWPNRLFEPSNLLLQQLTQKTAWTELEEYVNQELLQTLSAGQASAVSDKELISVRQTLQKLMLSPAIMTMRSVNQQVTDEINERWKSQIYAPWGQLSQRYPFNESGPDLGFSDIHQFLGKKEGRIHRFIEQYIRPFCIESASGLTPRSWNGVGLVLAPELNALMQLDFQDIDKSSAPQDGALFELKPIPSHGIADIQLTIDGQLLRYRNGAQLWQTFRWQDPVSSKESRLNIQLNNGHSIDIFSAQGRMSLLRLLSIARQRAESNQTIHLSWPVDVSNPALGSVSFLYRHISGPDPLRIVLLKHISVPSQIIQTRPL